MVVDKLNEAKELAERLHHKDGVEGIMRTVKRIAGRKYIYDGCQDIYDYLYRDKPSHWIAWQVGLIEVEYGYTKKYNSIERAR